MEGKPVYIKHKDIPSTDENVFTNQDIWTNAYWVAYCTRKRNKRKCKRIGGLWKLYKESKNSRIKLIKKEGQREQRDILLAWHGTSKTCFQSPLLTALDNTCKMANSSGAGKGAKPKRPRLADTPPSPAESSMIPAMRSMLDQQMDRINEWFTAFEEKLEREVKSIKLELGRSQRPWIFKGMKYGSWRLKFQRWNRNLARKKLNCKRK